MIPFSLPSSLPSSFLPSVLISLPRATGYQNLASASGPLPRGRVWFSIPFGLAKLRRGEGLRVNYIILHLYYISKRQKQRQRLKNWVKAKVKTNSRQIPTQLRKCGVSRIRYAYAVVANSTRSLRSRGRPVNGE